MTHRRPSLFTRTDAGLIGLAFVGLIVFALLMPRQHPDALIDHRGREAALVAAEAFLADAGFAVPDGVLLEIHQRRNNALLDTLQRVHGRASALTFLRTEEGRRLGVYHWRVEAEVPGTDGALTIKVTQDAQVFSFSLTEPEAFVKADLPSWGDTAMMARADSAAAALGVPVPMRFGNGPTRVGYVLERSALAPAGLQDDSSSSPTGRYVAHLTGGTVAGRAVTATLTFDDDARLLDLDPSYATVPNPDRPPSWLTALALALYVLTILGVLIAFFKRLSERLVDTRAALHDALWMALVGVVWIVHSSSPSIIDSVPNTLLAIGIIVFNAVVVGLGVAFMGFAASGAAESIARPVWPERLASLSLMRNGFWYDARVGSALVRGLAASAIAVGGLATALALLPQVRLYLGSGTSGMLSDEIALSVGPWIASFYTLTALIQVYAVLLALGAALYRRIGPRVLVVLAVLLVPMQLVVLSAQPGWMLLLHLIPVGIVLGMFWRHDALTAFVALFAYGILWDTAYLWTATASPGRLGGYIVLGLLAGLFILGLVVMGRGRYVRQDQVLVPAYIRERQHEARLERELEIARSVQTNFLPREMPRMHGLDVAALCLPAQEVGGDYYDFIPLDDHRLALVIGDVSGKGIEAAFFMTLVTGVIRTLAREELAPDEVLRRANRVFFDSAPRGTFVSMIYGIVDTDSRTFTFARAGHNPLILHRAPSQQADMIQPPGLGLGLDAGPHFNRALRVQTLDLSPGDTLVLYTDGYSEAMNLDRVLYTDEMLAEQASKPHGPTARHTLDALTRGVNAFMNGASQHDDMTMIVLRVTSPSALSQDISST